VRPDPLRFWCQYGDDPCRSMVVAWAEAASAYADTTGYVRRVGSSVWRAVSGTSADIPGSGDGWAWPLQLRHRVILTGLQPGVEYEWRFTPHGKTFRLRTLPASLAEPVQAIYSSDTAAYAHLQRMVAFDPEFVAMFGDFGGENGATEYTQYTHDTLAGLTVLQGQNSRLVPLVLAPGNHDSMVGGGAAPKFQVLYYWQGNNDGTTGLWTELRASDWLSLLVLDSEHNNSGPLTGSTTQEVWYQARLAEGGAIRHRQVACHVPGFPGYRWYLWDQETRVRQFFYMPAEQAGVRIGFGGHDHAYVRSYRMLHDEFVVPSIVADDAPLGARWWVCAPGPRELQPDLWYAEEAANDGVRSEHIFRVTFTAESQTIESLNVSNQVFHTHVEPANPNAPKVGSSSGRRGRVGDSWGTVARQARQSGSWVGVT
jgi:hypothetical protein